MWYSGRSRNPPSSRSARRTSTAVRLVRSFRSAAERRVRSPCSVLRRFRGVTASRGAAAADLTVLGRMRSVRPCHSHAAATVAAVAEDRDLNVTLPRPLCLFEPAGASQQSVTCPKRCSIASRSSDTPTSHETLATSTQHGLLEAARASALRALETTKARGEIGAGGRPISTETVVGAIKARSARA